MKRRVGDVVKNSDRVIMIYGEYNLEDTLKKLVHMIHKWDVSIAKRIVLEIDEVMQGKPEIEDIMIA